MLAEVKFTIMEKEITEILKDYMTERQIELALPRLVNFISSNTVLADSLPLHRCQYCGVMTNQSDDECYKKP